jgi:hypothetical protein
LALTSPSGGLSPPEYEPEAFPFESALWIPVRMSVVTEVAVAYLCGMTKDPRTWTWNRKQKCLPLSHDILCLTFSLTHFCQARFIGNDKRMRLYSMTCLLPVNCSAYWTVRIFFARVRLPRSAPICTFQTRSLLLHTSVAPTASHFTIRNYPIIVFR